ncbi:MAG: dTDP-4-dehydrorhamnose reductase [Actinobacteria bacterium]|nr:dTDP-4-dehydrorhamnose reductase [Actinomycetota bacterium]
MRVFVTGAGGQIGNELQAVFASDDVTAATHADLEITDRDAVHAAINAAQPDVVVHAAAWTAVDDCESDPERALTINGVGTRHVTEAAASAGAHLTYLSTDYVFDGRKPDPYIETDTTNPLSVYGSSKLAGEHEVAAYDQSLVVRVSWVCGRHGRNMVKTILELARTHDRLRFVADQIGHPTFADDAATMVHRLVSDRRTGTYHVTNQGAVSWFEFAQAVLDSAGLDPTRVDPITTAEMPRPAPRPANSVLENAALRSAGLPLLSHFREPLDRLVAELT